jgi:hypothetical protein
LENFKGWQSKVDQRSKSSSPRGCIWHMDRVGQTPGRKGSRADRPCFMPVWPTASRTCVYTRSRWPRRWRKSVEAAPLGQPTTWLGYPATTWHQTDLSKSVELPHGPINTPPPTVEMRWQATFGDSTCKALILSAVARYSLVGRVARLPHSLSVELCRNPLGSDRVSRL